MRIHGEKLPANDDGEPFRKCLLIYNQSLITFYGLLLWGNQKWLQRKPNGLEHAEIITKELETELEIQFKIFSTKHHFSSQ